MRDLERGKKARNLPLVVAVALFQEGHPGSKTKLPFLRLVPEENRNRKYRASKNFRREIWKIRVPVRRGERVLNAGLGDKKSTGLTSGSSGSLIPGRSSRLLRLVPEENRNRKYRASKNFRREIWKIRVPVRRGERVLNPGLRKKHGTYLW